MIFETEPIYLQELDRESAIQMFENLSGSYKNDKKIFSVCELIGDHPLAIKIAATAARSDSLTLERLTEQLRAKKLDALSDGTGYSERDIRATIELSYNNLSSAEDTYVFAVIGAFVLSGAPLSAIAQVAGISNTRCREQLAALESRSLVQKDERDPWRYRLHPLLYELAREKLRQYENSAKTLEVQFGNTPTARMINFYVEYSNIHRTDFAELEAVYDNVIHAADCAWECKAWEAVYKLWEALDDWLDRTGDWNNMYLLTDRAVEANRKLESRETELANALLSRSTYFDTTGKIQAAMKDAEEGLALGYKVGDSKTIASGLVRVGSIYSSYFNELERASKCFEEAWRICQDIPDWEESAYIAYQLGLNHWSNGDSNAARDLFEKSIAISRRLSSDYMSRRYEAFCTTSLGGLLIEQREYKQAREYLERSLELKAGDRYSIAISIKALASLELALENNEEALKLWREACRIFKDIGATSQIIRTLQESGGTYHSLKMYEEAIVAYEEAKSVGKESGLPKESLAEILSALGTVYHMACRYDEALAAFREGLEIFAVYLE